MPAPTPYTPERTWLIDQYLTGTLPNNLHEQVEQRRRSDPAFDQQVLAQSLVTMYLEQERAAATFEQTINELTNQLGEQKTTYKNHKVIQFLPRLLLVAGVAAACLIWLSLSPTGQPGRVPLTPFDPDGYGFGDRPVVVVRYSHAPGFLGRFRTTDQYRWPADTLFLYGKTIYQQPLDSLALEQANLSDLYRLTTGKQTYLLRKGQPERTDLYLYETR